MKKLLVSLVIFFHMSLSLYAQSTIDEVCNAFATGNAKEIAKKCDNIVGILIDDVHSNFSKSQGERILFEFFKKNNPVNFEIKRIGESPNGTSKILIGELITKSDRIKVILHFRAKKNDYYLLEVKFSAIN